MQAWGEYKDDYIVLCDNCWKSVEKALEDTVQIPIMHEGCDTYRRSGHNRIFPEQHTIILVKAKTTTVSPKSTNNGQWKLTNDSRHKTLKAIKTNSVWYPTIENEHNTEC
jgi:hypothetical protein